jgi:hypothetical protein
MKAPEPLTRSFLAMNFTRLTINVPELLFFCFLESLSLDQVVVLALILVVAGLRAPTDPSSCR